MPHDGERLTMIVALGGFADLWLYSETDYKVRGRDFRASVVATYPCERCGAVAGEPCHRLTVAGVLERKLPHFGRGRPGRQAITSRRGVERGE